MRRPLSLIAAGLLGASTFVVAAPPVGAASARKASVIQTPLATKGARIVDSAGRPVVLQGVNWFGFETSNHVVHGLWTRDYRAMLAQVRRLGFNTIRLPFSLEAVHSRAPLQGIDFSDGKNAALRGLTPLEAMDAIIAEAGRQGILILLDNHSHADNAYMEGLWYGQGWSEDQWVATWKLLAKRYRGQPNVIGADLKNEPHGEATWGTGGATDWRRAAERAGNAVLGAAPNWLVVVEGVGGGAPVPGQQLDTHWWGGNLEGVRKHPVRLDRPNRLVYSPHEYGPGVFPQPWFGRPNTPALLEQRWRTGFGFIAEQGIAPILVGEFGGRNVDTQSAEGRWQRQFFDFISRTGASWTYWSLNPDSGDTGGVLKDDWTTVQVAKTALLQRMIQRQRIAFGSRGAFTVPRRAGRPVRRAPAARGTKPSRPAQPVQPAQPAKPAPAQPAGPLLATVVVESSWEAGWCGHVEVSGGPGSLAGVQARLTLPAGTRIAQTWNAERSGDSGRVTLTLPAWARVDGSAYTATGFCVDGSGRATDVTID
ncbi:cellulase family glycosylhydrolase [Conexibacter sp. JD483]|uniref:cellulase family glycosylhydrolase n=1 Tax=unclassified Conexibacter TaxID=2627773 RepID=UPI0027167C05|nr:MULTISPECIES: cellulase family glycosylhydrolase [unclassified Conexibacter]MDO8186287.1 cellulase family glycosylhydrolase [Conexibacter sp. CPCC 205706]MDO8197492.1 cellulase family glycosylhydrolase [Conexibacter sp. CPCC 205762]MDR9370275.1 cellulase family glycosylhydrolase [Conexibacter sp. JD483]